MMEQITYADTELGDESSQEGTRVHFWRAEQLLNLGVSSTIAMAFADLVDWHEIAALVTRGCPPELALEIVR